MQEQQYYEEIEHLIKKNEIKKQARKLEENQTLVTTYWHIGKLLVEVQGGSKNAKYGNELIKKWSIKLTHMVKDMMKQICGVLDNFIFRSKTWDSVPNILVNYL